LRSFNRRMPEELNRLATDHLSDLLLAPTRVAMAHLANEGLAARSRWVGDVMHDALLFNLERARLQSGVLQRLGLEAGRYSVATVHRAENTAPDALRRILTALATVAHGSHRIILPLHPRTRAVLGSHPGTDPGSPGVCHVEPLSYLDMLCLVESAGLVLTDSGGLQKEAFMLGTPCVTFRTETEWTETVAAGANVVAGLEPEAIVAAARGFLAAGAGAASRQRLRAAAAAEYGPGDAAARIVDVLLEAAPPA
jgi:UDP-N-acetylglucosamine 2-epimerase